MLRFHVVCLATSFRQKKKKDIKLQSSALNNITCHPLNQESLNQDDSESEKFFSPDSLKTTFSIPFGCRDVCSESCLTPLLPPPLWLHPLFGLCDKDSQDREESPTLLESQSLRRKGQRSGSSPARRLLTAGSEGGGWDSRGKARGEPGCSELLLGQ